ncbi:MAG: family 10 glycosylhydrolase [Clostridiales bacterium]|nr:family 10 glycosylhydrolase [Clostridiales bacterium]
MGYSMSREQKRARIQMLRKTIAVLFVLCVILFVADIVCVFVLLGKKGKSKPKATETTPTSVSVSEDTSADSSGDSSASESSEPTDTTPVSGGVEVKEYLPQNDLAESYWGPLPAVTEVKPVQHNKIHGIYIASCMHFEENLELAKKTDINAFVIDLKDEGGGVYYNTSNEMAKEMHLWVDNGGNWTDKGPGSYVQNAYNLEEIVKKCHENDIKVIGRIVCFNDPSMARNHPEMSIKDANGESMHFNLEGKHQFLNPYDPRVWDFLISLAQEAVEKGVDEIQFDYVRFPTISTKKYNEKPYFGPEDSTPSRIDAINRFLQTARRKIQDPTGIPVTADVFGIILSSELDGKLIGQGWDTVGLTGIDSLCPMLYPSHYADNTQLNGKTFDYPDLYPHDVMYNALMAGKTSASADGYATVRPYVQAFTATWISHHLNYKVPEVKAQIQAIYDAGYDEWILWNAAANYTNRYE